jgi:DNA-binding transcriptional MocR family regulator
MELSKLKSLRQVAKEMELSDSRISQLCKEAGVEGRRVGTARLLSPKEVETLKSVARRPYQKAN